MGSTRNPLMRAWHSLDRLLDRAFTTRRVIWLAVIVAILVAFWPTAHANPYENAYMNAAAKVELAKERLDAARGLYAGALVSLATCKAGPTPICAGAVSAVVSARYNLRVRRGEYDLARDEFRQARDDYREWTDAQNEARGGWCDSWSDRRAGLCN